MQRKQFLRALGAVIGAGAIGSLLSACGGGDASSPLEPVASAAGTSGATTLSAEEIAALKFMREEEKLARDVYAALYGVWGATVFDNISQSETTHTDTILALLEKYGIADPAAGKAPGEFEDPELQALYNTLIAAGRVSLIEGLKVGALIEETDIRDITEKKLVTDEADILRVYDSLMCGSRNHLRAFNGALLDQGVTYVPTVITQAEWDAIANSPMETCGG
jgi:hypothetical protein